jgi:hypothetical protein
MPTSEICRKGSLSQTREDKAKGGHAAGIITRDRQTGIHNPEHRRGWASLGGLRSTHLKWHVARGLANPQCGLCIQDLD